jgi:putative hemolysin
VSTGLGLVLILLLVLGNAFFVIAEYALVTAGRPRLHQRAEEGSRGARTALRLMDDPVRVIGTVQVGITALGILLGAIGEPVIRELVEPPASAVIAFLLAFLTITYLSVVLGELVPKAVALQRAEAVAVVIARPIALLQRAFGPVVWVLQGSAKLVLRPLGIPAAPAGSMVHSVDELRGMLAEAEDSGVIEEAEEEMLYRVFDFADQEAAEVMVPWSDVAALPIGLTGAEALERVVDAPHTRYPVFRDTLDHIEGVLHVRDLFIAVHELGQDAVRIADLLRPVEFVPETKDLGALLQEMRRSGHQLVIVINEYGSTIGLVTLEDLVEEIIGDIEDEFDLPDESVSHLDDGRVRVFGSFTVDDFNEQFGTELPVERFRTLGGLVFGELGRAPSPGDAARFGGVVLEVERVEGPRVDTLLVTLPDDR